MKKDNRETVLKINIIFDNNDETDIIEEVLEKLSKYYIEDMLNSKI